MGTALRPSCADAGSARRESADPHPRALAWLTPLACATLLAACSSTPSHQTTLSLIAEGEYGKARARAIETAPSSPNDRHYILARQRYALLALADGIPFAAEASFDQTYDFLRTQGINKGTKGATVVLGEAASRTWKGEAYEQAMAYAYVAAHDGARADWGNVRAVADNSLLLVRDFSPDAAGETKVAPSDFELGYALRAIAEDQLGLADQRDETLDDLVALAPRLEGFAHQLRARDYNAVLMVDYGLAPERYAGGRDGVEPRYRPRTRSGDEPLKVSVDGREVVSAPVTTDVNRLAEDVRWNGLQSLRSAKSAVGDALIIGGGITAASSDDEIVQIAGLGAVLVGALTKATSSVDTTHLEALPQRTYIALVNLDSQRGSQVELSIPGRAHIILPIVPGSPAHGAAPLHYVRLASQQGGWADARAVRFANDATGPLATPTLPWVLGGRCVRTPTYALMSEYHAAGLPRAVSLDDLLSAYREEGIEIVTPSSGGAGPVGRHVLEGGRFLFTPDPASAGFVRLFAQDHPGYVPRSKALGAIRDAIAAPTAPPATQ